ncbi:MAG: polysaccharide biosynthesis tyrosine autokinase [Phycisphaerales bacterium]
MTPTPPPRPGAPRPGGPAPGQQAATVDPVKLFKKYKIVLVAAFVFSMIVGVGTYVVWLKFFPSYTSNVVFEAQPADTKTEQINEANVDRDEIERFMRTQTIAMTNQDVLEAVLNDGRLRTEASQWYNARLTKGALDKRKAREDLEKSISATIIPETYFIEMRASAGDPVEATALAKLTKEAYLRTVNFSKRSDIDNRRDSLSRRLDELSTEIQDLSSRRQRIVRDEELDTIDAGRSEASEKLAAVGGQLLEVQQTIKAVGVSLERFEEMLSSPTGIQYTDTQRAQAEQMPEVANLNQQITTLEAERLTMRAQGFMPGHRNMRQIESSIQAYKQKLADKKEQKLREIFDAEVDGVRRTMNQLRAQEDELLSEREELRTKLTELTGILTEVDDIEKQIDRMIIARADAADRLDTLEAAADLNTVARIDVYQSERLPTDVTWPKYLVIPGIMVLICGATAGLIVARELFDQRIKGASDVAMIPRTKVMGVIPDATEDPSAPARVELAFADQPRGVLAESFRQLRTTLVKQMTRAGHRSLVVVSGQPGSGATSVVTNLAHACAASDQKVLVVDANFRRPSLHRVFEVEETNGLADVLAGEKTLPEAAQTTATANLDVLSAGSRDRRVFERLGTEAMASLLNEAAADYDLVLIDVAPAIVAGDAMAVANRADASMLVARAMREKRGMVARLKNELSDCRAEFMGVLVNAAKSAAGGYMRKNIRTSHGYQDQKPEVEPAAPSAA